MVTGAGPDGGVGGAVDFKTEVCGVVVVGAGDFDVEGLAAAGGVRRWWLRGIVAVWREAVWRGGEGM